MKLVIRRISVFILAVAAMLCLAACAKVEETSGWDTVTEVQEGSEVVEQSQESNKTGGKASMLKPKQENVSETESSEQETVYEKVSEPEIEPDTTVIPLEIYLSDHEREEWNEDGTQLWFTGSCQTLCLGGEDAENYPELAEKLKELAYSNLDSMHTVLDDSVEIVKEMGGSFSGSEENTYYLQRADSSILSVRREHYSYAGGAHPYYATWGINYDPVTGTELGLADVLTDPQGLLELLDARLIEKYGEDVFDNDPGQLFVNIPEEEFAWTMGYQGITFYFPPYLLAPYAAGSFTATVWFEEAPEYFQEKYVTAPQSGYVIPVRCGEETEVDLDSLDGQKDTLAVYFEVVEDSYFKKIRIDRNGEAFYSDDYYFEDGKLYIVCVGEPGNERFYLYVEAYTETTSFYIFDLNQEEISCIGDHTVFMDMYFPGFLHEDENLEGAYYIQVFNNPAEFTMSENLMLLGIYGWNKTYRVNSKTGLPETMQDYYTLPEGTGYDTSLIPLEVYLLEEETWTEMPAGTQVQFLRTDGATYVDLQMADGRECRVEIDRSEWPAYINGKSESECFEKAGMYW